MTTRILLFSDVHLDRAYPWATAEMARERRNEARNILTQIVSETRQRDVDILVCAGDLFSRQEISPDSVRWAMKVLGSARVPVLVAPGDEDSMGPRSPYTQQGWPDNVRIFEESQLVPAPFGDGVTIWGAAHRMESHVASFLDGFHCDQPGVHLALIHAAERGGMERESDSRDCAPFTDEQVALSGLTHVLAGHFHSSHPGGLHTYAGVPIAHRFGQGPVGAAMLITVDATGVVARERIPLDSTPLIEKEVSLEGLGRRAQVVQAARAVIGEEQGIIRLKLIGAMSYDLGLQCADLVSQLSFERVQVLLDLEELRIDIPHVERNRGPNTVAGEFARDVCSSAMPEREMHRVLAIGLRALDGRADLDPFA